MLVSFKSIGDWAKTKLFFNRMANRTYLDVLNECGRQGVEALQQNTPKDSGQTADSWSYNIVSNGNATSIEWVNDNLANGWFPVAIMLQYGHGTGTGGYVQGYDYINPAIRPVFDDISNKVWEAIRKS